jgi:hypothetical protein
MGAWAGGGAAPGGTSGGGAQALVPLFLWEGGGGIYAWTVWQFGGTTSVSYAPIGGTSVVGAHDYILHYSASGGTYKVRWEYDADLDILITPRVRAADGTWSSKPTVMLPLDQNAVEFTIELAAGEAFGLHAAPQGGAASFNYCRAFAGPA